MLTVDLKSLISRLNPHCSGALEGAAGLCVARGHYEVTVEHLLARLLDEPGGDLPLILRAFEVDAVAVKTGIGELYRRGTKEAISSRNHRQ